MSGELNAQALRVLKWELVDVCRIILREEKKELERILKKMDTNIADLTAAIAALKTAIDALPASVAPVDLQPSIDAVNALTTEVQAKTPPSTP